MKLADLVVIIIYLIGTAAIGLYFSRRNGSTEEYFLGGRNIPGWAVGLSMIGTSISSITFLALPAAAFALDWRQGAPYLVFPIICAFAVIFFIPIFRRTKITSAYEYLEQRFGRAARLYGSLCFVIGEATRLGTVLFLLAIPVSLMTGFNLNTIIIVTGIFVAFYTVTGGIDAVIWTDVIQSFIFWGGGLFVAGFMLYRIPGGFDTVIRVGNELNKFSFGPMEVDLSQRTFYVLLILGVFNWLSMYTANQNVIQRYLTAKSTREARKATLICAAGSLPTWFAFYFIGTTLFVFFRYFHDPRIAAMPADAVFPYFIINYLPSGFTGLLIAAVMAAAMSSLSSSLNSFAAVCTTDLLATCICPGRDDRYYLRWARIFSCIAVVIMIGGAIIIANIPKESMVDLGYIIGGLMVMLVMGFFILGFCCPSVGNRSVWLGFLCGTLSNIYLVLGYFNCLPSAIVPAIHVYWNSIICQIVMIVSAIVFAWLFPEKRSAAALENLTLASVK